VSEQGRDWILIGRTAGAFGLRGEIKVEPLTDFPERFDSLLTIHVGPGHECRNVETTRPHGKHFLIKLQGVDDMVGAAALRGLDVSVPRAAAMTLPEGHYLLDDLLGVAVVTRAGQMVGAIREVLRTGSNDVYVVHAGRAEVLVPGIRDAVLELDLVARRMVIDSWVLEPPT
jgi:16S rRNA processing protein RimM